MKLLFRLSGGFPKVVNQLLTIAEETLNVLLVVTENSLNNQQFCFECGVMPKLIVHLQNEECDKEILVRVAKLLSICTEREKVLDLFVEVDGVRYVSSLINSEDERLQEAALGILNHGAKQSKWPKQLREHLLRICQLMRKDNLVLRRRGANICHSLAAAEATRKLVRHKSVSGPLIALLEKVIFEETGRKEYLKHVADALFHCLYEEEPPFVRPITNESWAGLVEPFMESKKVTASMKYALYLLDTSVISLSVSALTMLKTTDALFSFLRFMFRFAQQKEEFSKHLESDKDKYLAVIKQLLDHSDVSIQRQALQLLARTGQKNLKINDSFGDHKLFVPVVRLLESPRRDVQDAAIHCISIVARDGEPPFLFHHRSQSPAHSRPERDQSPHQHLEKTRS